MEITAQFAVLVPVIIGAVEAAKRAGLATRYAPLLALGLAVGAVGLLSGSWDSQTLLEGVVAGLSAAGLYSGTRSTLNV